MTQPRRKAGTDWSIAGGANRGDRPPASGCLHRAGCEDGRSPRFM